LDATRKWKEEGFNREWPDELAMDKDVELKMEELLKKHKLL
jgi:4-hydroxy-3-polyprenylbenzoate decarboxylase